jgi:heavy metal translocating P-type ATPase
MGCKQVFHMLAESADGKDPGSFRETELFKKCQAMGIIPSSEGDLERRTRDSINAENPAGSKGEGVLGLNLRVSQMWCPACAWVIEEALKKTRGILDARCNFSTDRVRCDYDPVLISPTRIMQAIDSLGYRAAIPGEGTESKEWKREFIRFAVSAFLTMNVMMLSFSLYSGFFTDLSPETIYKLSWPICIMATAVLFYGGQRIYRRAWAGLSSAAFGMETLITAGSFSAYIYSTYNLLTGSIHLYYDTASMLITLVLLGKMLERRAKDEVQEDLGNFFSLRPNKVRICSEAYPEGRYVAAEQLSRGNVFQVQEGEIIPADGIVLEGGGSVDEASLTGEALPAAKKGGDRLKSGTKVIQGTFRIRAEGVGEDSTLGQMIKIMERALEGRTPLEGKTDLALQWFVPIILILAAGTGLFCFLSGHSPQDSLIRAVTVMVIACPCALGIAIPLARVAGISASGKKGILVRDFSSFEQARLVDTFVLDKTGTITKGQWSLLEIIPFEPFEEEEVLALAASLEKKSDHYIALEIKRTAEERELRPVNVDRIHVFTDGISARAGRDEVRIGSRDFLADELAALNPWPEQVGPSDEQIHSLVFMSRGGRPCAIFVFGDRIRENSSLAVKQLIAMGYNVSMVSGDGDKTTKNVGREVGIDEAYGGKRPQDKASFIDELQKQGHGVAMVGDGINDAPALVQSDLAVAIHSGTHLGKEAADMTLMRGDPAQILDFMDLAKRVNSKIYQNLICAFFYNIISIPIAMSGLLNPLIAVCAMLMSSLTVIGNTLLLTRKN